MNSYRTDKDVHFIDDKVISHHNSRTDPRFVTTRPSARPFEQAGLSSSWLTAAEAAEYLKVGKRTLLLWVRQGKVKGYPLSGTKRHVWRFRRPDLDAILVGPSVPCSKGAP
jgi:excisionase family DNA binding protein